MARQHTIVRLTAAPPAHLGLALSRAFHDEPNFTYIFPDEEVRRAALQWFFGVFVVRMGLGFGAVYSTETADGAAVWLRPGDSITTGGALRAGILAMPFIFGWGGFRRSMRLGNAIERVHKQSIPGPHWYLMALGVAPSRQGQGIGGALLQPVLARADADGLPCYLETFHERNLPFYAKQDFTVAGSAHISPGGPTFWTMVREPRPSDAE